MPSKVYPEGFIKIPSLFCMPFTKESDIPITVGTLKEGYEEVLQVFKDNFKYGYEPEGCNFAAYVEDELVVDLWGGYADKSSEKRWDAHTIGPFFSCTKALTAITVALQVDRSLLQYSDTISKYWPEFGANGKEKITVLQVLHHQAGMPYVTNVDGSITALDFDVYSDVKKMDRLMEVQKPLEQHGVRTVYHAATYGWIIDGLMRRIDEKKRNVGEFLIEEITDVHGVEDIFIGNPREVEYRIARIRSHIHNDVMVVKEWLCSPIAISKLGVLFYTSWSVPRRQLFNVHGSRDYEIFNQPALRTVGQPAVNGLGNARSLAKVLDLFEGGKLCSRLILDKLREPLIMDEFDAGIGFRMSRGYGFFFTKSPLGDWQYGHQGIGGQNVKTDTKRRITFAYITNGMKAGQGDHTRTMKRLEAALYRSIQRSKIVTEQPKLEK